MNSSSRRVGLAVAALALLVAGPALAQEDIDAGKTPAQLYAQDCAICHKTPHGLTKVGGLLALQNYLRVHYTASRQSAAAIAAYLMSADSKEPPPREHRRAARPSKGERAKAATAEKAKPDEEKSKKAGEAKMEAKPSKSGSV